MMRMLIILVTLSGLSCTTINPEYLEVVDRPGQLLGNGYFYISYNPDTKQPNWVAYQLTRDMVEENGDCNENHKFMVDRSVGGGTPDPKVYKDSDYHRGHMVPRSDMSKDDFACEATFLMSNTCPQYEEFNRFDGIWFALEEQVRDWAGEYEEVYVVCGPTFRNDIIEYIGEDRIPVPDGYFKVVFAKEPSQTIGFLFDHTDEKVNEDLREFVKPVDEIEIITGYDFFSALPDDREKKIEAEVNKDDWVWESDKSEEDTDD